MLPNHEKTDGMDKKYLPIKYQEIQNKFPVFREAKTRQYLLKQMLIRFLNCFFCGLFSIFLYFIHLLIQKYINTKQAAHLTFG